MGTLIDVKIPDIGDFANVDVIEVMVKPGDSVKPDDSLITIESDKATMEVPSPVAGVVRELKVKLGDKVSEGSPIVVVEATSDVQPAAQVPPASSAQPSATPQQAPREPAPAAPAAAVVPPPPGLAAQTPPAPAPGAPVAEEISAAEPAETREGEKPHASPSVRKFARQLGADLTLISGTGLKGRIFRTDVEKFVKSALAHQPAGPSRIGLDLAPWPKVDFARFGPIEVRPLSRIRRASKANLARNWVMIPHVTQFDEADVTDLEALRRQVNADHAGDGVRVTILSFIVKAIVAALVAFPEFNSSLDGDNLVLKKYFHIGFAADTPDGLVVPVLRDADKKGVIQISREMSDLAGAARAGKLKPLDIQGASMTISSLGGIGGTAFTPLINAPEVAILGVSRMVQKPVYRGDGFVPRTILPLSLAYDHRVIDGAVAARFITYLGSVLADLRRVLL